MSHAKPMWWLFFVVAFVMFCLTIKFGSPYLGFLAALSACLGYLIRRHILKEAADDSTKPLPAPPPRRIGEHVVKQGYVTMHQRPRFTDEALVSAVSQYRIEVLLQDTFGPDDDFCVQISHFVRFPKEPSLEIRKPHRPNQH